MTLLASTISIGECYVTLLRSLPQMNSSLSLFKQSIMTSMIAVMKFQLLSVTVEVQIAQEWYI